MRRSNYFDRQLETDSLRENNYKILKVAKYSYSQGFYHGFSIGHSFIGCNFIQINNLVSKFLRRPLMVIVETDNDGFIARNPDLPLFGYGDDVNESIEMLKSEIESLYFDLTGVEGFTEDWAKIKDLLLDYVVE